MKYFLLFSTFGLVAISGAFARDCAHRNYGHGSTVCVCNATYCDDIAPIVKTANGIATSIVTSVDGDRFARKQLHFSKTKPTHVAPTVTVTIDPHTKYQVIKGFGGAITDAAGINIAHLPKDMQTRLIHDYYGKEGIEYSLGRVPIGGSDFSTRPYSYDDHANDESLSKFALEPEDLKYKIPYMKLAQEVSPHKIYWFGSPWSSPAWMKTNDQINHGGLLKGHPGGKYYKMFAKYFVRFIEEYAKHKIPISGITIENEPGAGFNNRYPWNSLGFNKTLERDFIKLDLGPELHNKNYTKDKFDVMIFDDQLPYLKDFTNTVLGDPEAAKYVTGIAFHWYENNRANFHDLDEVHSKHKDIFLLATEACEEWHMKPQHVYLGSWDTFNRYSTDIIKDLNHWTTGWTDWNLVLSEKGGPNWVNNLVDAPIIVNGTSHEYYKQPFFYAMGHFSKILIPGSVRIRHEEKTTDKEILVTVFDRPDHGRTVTVLNKEKHAIILQVHDPASGYLDVTVKAQSMETLIYY